uniref:Pellino E3 ubiquitin protein ligase 1a n=1 Tax=Astyanax mexicanus TaxID=7994 RepID=A0A8B9R2F5_ASTMX
QKSSKSQNLRTSALITSYNTSQHSVSYTLSWAETVVVEYTDDNETDMYQVHRPHTHTHTQTEKHTYIHKYILLYFKFPQSVMVWRDMSSAGVDPLCFIIKGLVKDESPILLDGSLIDLCGVTLLWRSVEGLANSPTSSHLEALRLRLNAARPQCPVLLSTLAFPSLDGPRPRRPWAYMTCGHVHGYHPWQGRGGEVEAIKGDRECPLCRSRGPYVPLTLGRVSGVYTDAETPSHAFVPCGHVCSKGTAEHWSKTPLKRGTHSFHPACPFCLRQLRRDRPFVRLIFQGPLD